MDPDVWVSLSESYWLLNVENIQVEFALGTVC